MKSYTDKKDPTDAWVRDTIWFTELFPHMEYANLRLAVGDLYVLTRHKRKDKWEGYLVAERLSRANDALPEALSEIAAIRGNKDKNRAYVSGLRSSTTLVRCYCLETLYQLANVPQSLRWDDGRVFRSFEESFREPSQVQYRPELIQALVAVRSDPREWIAARLAAAAILGSDRANHKARREEYDWLLKVVFDPDLSEDWPKCNPPITFGFNELPWIRKLDRLAKMEEFRGELLTFLLKQARRLPSEWPARENAVKLLGDVVIPGELPAKELAAVVTVLLECLRDENVALRIYAAKSLTSICQIASTEVVAPQLIGRVAGELSKAAKVQRHPDVIRVFDESLQILGRLSTQSNK